MALRSNYSWEVVGGDCRISAYRTDPDHTPPKWQDELHQGDSEYSEAVLIIEQDRWAALQAGDYRQTAINENDRWYLRTASTGNSWECKLDEDGNELPNPCIGFPEPQPDPRNFEYALAQ